LKTELTISKQDISIRLVDFIIASIKYGLILKCEGRKLADNLEADFHIYRQCLKILEAVVCL
jgi:hypothetical protein